MEYSAGAINGQFYMQNTNYLNNLNYLPYHTPPHNSPAYSYNWSEILKPPPSPTDETCHYHHMRFPTPPITPPRSQGYNKKDFIDLSSVNSKTPVETLLPPTVAIPVPVPVSIPVSAPAVPVEAAEPLKVAEENLKEVGKSIRTQSVIMKVSQGQNLEHVNLTNDLCSTPEDSQTMNHLINISGSDSSSPTNDFICAWQDCGRFFESLESLAQHVTQIHAVANIEDGLYYCRWHGCQRSDRGFNARYKMLVHVRTHTKEKPHKCHLCEKSFSRAENLKIHIRSHSGEKPYKCTYEGCNKAYSNSSDRFKHTRTHTMEKPYKCKVPGCQKRYTDPSSLRKHVKTFKHSIQIMDNNHLPTHPCHQSEALSIPTDSNVAKKQDGFTKESSALGLSHLAFNPVKNYHIPSVVHEVEDEDHEMTQLYDRNSSQQIHSSFYWLPEKSLIKSYPSFYNETFYPLHHHHHHNHHNHHHHHGQSFPLEMDLDRPLDLTVHKVQ